MLNFKEEVCELFLIKLNFLEWNIWVVLIEDFDEFVINYFKGLCEMMVKFNVVVDEVDERFEEEKEILFVCCRRYVICEEMEKNILNDVGVSFWGYWELFVMCCLLFEMYLL